MLLNDDIVDSEKPDGMCSPNFFVDEFLGFFFTSFNLFYETSKICINNEWCFIRFLVLIKL